MQAQGQDGRHHERAEAELGPFGRARVAAQNGGIVRIRGPEATQPLLDPAGGTVEGGGKITNAPGGMGALQVAQAGTISNPFIFHSNTSQGDMRRRPLWSA
jgi:hypothetical protein